MYHERNALGGRGEKNELAVVATRARFVFLLIFNVNVHGARYYSRFSVGVRAIGPTERSRFCIADREPLEKGALAGRFSVS